MSYLTFIFNIDFVVYQEPAMAQVGTIHSRESGARSKEALYIYRAYNIWYLFRVD